MNEFTINFIIESINSFVMNLSTYGYLINVYLTTDNLIVDTYIQQELKKHRASIDELTKELGFEFSFELYSYAHQKYFNHSDLLLTDDFMHVYDISKEDADELKLLISCTSLK
tara:strand:+ start:1301 stop:1639 length:339 start_codon:yes stop_codon:yes gene_type:complete